MIINDKYRIKFKAAWRSIGLENQFLALLHNSRYNKRRSLSFNKLKDSALGSGRPLSILPFAHISQSVCAPLADHKLATDHCCRPFSSISIKADGFLALQV